MEIVAASGKPLSAQLDGLAKTVTTPELRVDASDDTKFGVVAKVAAHYKGRRPVVDVDGVRVLFDKGWGLVRASNTQPVLVMRFDGENIKMLGKYSAEITCAQLSQLFSKRIPV